MAMRIIVCFLLVFCLCINALQNAKLSLTEEVLRRIEELEEHDRNQQHELQALRDQNIELVKEVNHLKEREREAKSNERKSVTRQAPGQAAAFYVKLSKTEINLDPGQVVKFDNITSNIGNSYDSSSGKFTAPEDGLYWFSVSLLGHASNTEFNYEVNDVMYSRLKCYAQSNGFQPSSQAAVFDLKKGDTVAIVNVGRFARLYGLLFTSFSGFRISGPQSGSQIVG